MTATPSISITGVVTNVAMTQISSTNSYTYNWNVDASGIPSSGTYYATVAGTASATGGAYAGTESITFTIDSTPPTVTESSVPNANSCTSNVVAEDLNIFLVGLSL